MPAVFVCVCWLIGENVKTATSIFHVMMTKAQYFEKQRGLGSTVDPLQTASALRAVLLFTV